MMRSQFSLVQYYAQRAQEYERVYQKPERQADLRRLRALLPKVFVGKRVLEIACGTDYWTEVVAKSAASVVGIDINEETLKIARAKPMPSGRVTLEQADAYDIPSFSSPFSAALAAFWWSHIPKSRLDHFLRGLHRQLEPGAKAMFIDNVYVESSSTPLARNDAEGNTYQRRSLEDGTFHEVLKNFPTRDELSRTVAESAKDVRIEFLEYYWILSYAVLPTTIHQPPTSPTT